MKLGPVTKLDKRNKTTSKKFDVNVASENCDVIIFFCTFGEFGAVRRPDFGHRVCKSYAFSNSFQKCFQKNADISKNNGT